MSVKKGFFCIHQLRGRRSDGFLGKIHDFYHPNVWKMSVNLPYMEHMGHYSKLSAASTGSPLIDDSPSLKAFHKTLIQFFSTELRTKVHVLSHGVPRL